MGQKRFHPRIPAGIVVGYIGFVLLVIGLVSGSWSVSRPNPSSIDQALRHKNLFARATGMARVCQATMIISFLINLMACIIGMTSSYAVTRPRLAGLAAKRFRMNSENLNRGPRVSGWLYISSSCFTLVATITATAAVDNNMEKIGYSVILAWLSIPFCVLAGILLIRALPPQVPFIGDGADVNGDEERIASTRGKMATTNEVDTTEALVIGDDVGVALSTER